MSEEKPIDEQNFEEFSATLERMKGEQIAQLQKKQRAIDEIVDRLKTLPRPGSNN